jgi:hypothetical protein
MDRCGGLDPSGIASFRRTSAVDTCVPGPASGFGRRPGKPPERPTRQEQSCRQCDNISVLLHEGLRCGHAAQVARSTFESKIRVQKIDRVVFAREPRKIVDAISSKYRRCEFAGAASLPSPAISAPARSSYAVRRRRARVAQTRRSDRLLAPRSSRRASNRSDRPTPSAVRKGRL